MKEASRGFIKAIIIVGLLFAVVYIVSYRNWINKKFGDNNFKYNEEGLNVEKKEVNVSDYLDLYNKVSFDFLENNFGEEFFNIYYGNEKFSNEYYLFVGVLNIISKDLVINCNYDRVLSSKDVDSSIKSIFGNVEYDKKTFETLNHHFSIEYNEELDSFHVLTDKCSGYDFSNGGIKSELVDAEMFQNKLYLDEVVMYVDYSIDSNLGMKFNYRAGIDKNSKFISNSYEDVDKKLLPVYRYTFKNENNNYYLESIKINK